MRRFDADYALNDAENALVACFRVHGPVVTFGEIFAVSRAAGDVPRGLDRTLSRSPIIRRVRQGLYTLVGTPLTRQGIADAAARMQPTQSGGELRYNVGILDLNNGLTAERLADRIRAVLVAAS